MGAITFSLDFDLAGSLARELGLRAFVETGTFRGDTVCGALRHFEEIHSIEISPQLFAAARERFAAEPTVHLHNASSPDVLRTLQKEFANQNVFYWLDAHWCVAEGAGGEGEPCPLPAELEAISVLNEGSVIAIDDARGLLSPPRASSRVKEGPLLWEILPALQKLNSRHRLIICNDIILFYPPAAENTVRKWAFGKAVDWLEIVHQAEGAALARAKLKETQKLLKAANRENHRLRRHPFRNLAAYVIEYPQRLSKLVLLTVRDPGAARNVCRDTLLTFLQENGLCRKRQQR